jgi:Putative adhesin
MEMRSGNTLQVKQSGGGPVSLRMTSSRWVISGLLVLAGVAVLSGPSRAADETFHHVYPLGAGGSFVLENVNGSVHVEGWDRDEVEVSAVKTGTSETRDVQQVKIEVDNSKPNQISVHTRYPKGQGAEVAVEYHVHVPYRVLLGSVGTVNGSVVVRGVEGGGDLRSVNGNIEVSDSSGRFSEKTTNGDIRLELHQLIEGGPMNLETVNGSVLLGLPAGAKADLKVLSMNGDVYSELPIPRTAGAPAPHAFKAKLGTGGGEISVRTVNGGIRLLQSPGV